MIVEANTPRVLYASHDVVDHRFAHNHFAETKLFHHFKNLSSSFEVKKLFEYILHLIE